MIGPTGPKMTELAGQIADGAVFNYCVPPEYNDFYMTLPLSNEIHLQHHYIIKSPA